MSTYNKVLQRAKSPLEGGMRLERETLGYEVGLRYWNQTNQLYILTSEVICTIRAHTGDPTGLASFNFSLCNLNFISVEFLTIYPPLQMQRNTDDKWRIWGFRSECNGTEGGSINGEEFHCYTLPETHIKPRSHRLFSEPFNFRWGNDVRPCDQFWLRQNNYDCFDSITQFSGCS